MDLEAHEKRIPQREREMGVVTRNVGAIVFKFWLLQSI